MKTSIRELVDAMPERFEPFSTRTNFSVGESLTKRQQKTIQERFPVLSPIYEQGNGFRAYWSALRVPHLVGHMSVPPWAEVSRMLRGTNHPYHAYTSRGWIPFDLDGRGDFATFIDASGDSPRLMRTYPGVEFELPVSIEKYVEIGLSVGGMFGWQDHLLPDTPVLRRASYDGFYENVLSLFGAKVTRQFTKPTGEKRVPAVPRLPSFHVPDDAKRATYRFDGSVDPVEIRMAQLAIGTPFPRELVNFYLRTGIVDMDWSLGPHRALFSILKPVHAFNRDVAAKNRTWAHSYGTRIRSKAKRFQDKYHLIAKENDVVFSIVEGEVRLHYVDSSLDLQAIQLSFSAYVEKMFQVGGLGNWEILFLKDKLDRGHPDVQDCLASIEACFPKLDTDAFLQRLVQ